MRLPPPRILPTPYAYGVAVLAPAAATAVELALWPHLAVVPFLLYYPVIFLVAYVGGLRPGFLAVALSTVLGAFWFLPPFGVFQLAGSAIVGAASFLVVGGLFSLVSASLREGYLERAAQERRFRSFVTTTAQVFWTASAAGATHEPSPSWQAFTGQRPGEIGGRGWLDALHPDDRARVAEAWERAIASRKPYELEYRVRRADGSYAMTLARAVPVVDDRGEVIEWVGANTDVSERHRAEEARREIERRFRTLVDAIPQLVFSARRDGSIDFVNGPFLRYTGVAAEVARGEGWTRAVHPDDAPAAAAAWTRAVARGEPVEGAFRIRRHDGAHRWHLVTASPLHGEDGEVRAWVGVCTDIHAQKESERAKSEAIEARDVFLSVAGHELKTPLTAAQLQIQNLLRQLRRGDGDAEALAARVAATASSVERLGGLVEALLDVSRIATGRLALDRERYDLSETVRVVAGRFVETARKRGSPLELELEPAVELVGDRLRVEQVLTNLVSNAIKYGDARPVRVSLARDEDRAVLRVVDAGIGIPPEHQARIFDRFERAVSARHYGGLGLGLWIARQIVDASGGRISVASTPGAGSTFTVVLPLAPPATDAERAPPARGAATGGAPARR